MARQGRAGKDVENVLVEVELELIESLRQIEVGRDLRWGVRG